MNGILSALKRIHAALELRIPPPVLLVVWGHVVWWVSIDLPGLNVMPVLTEAAVAVGLIGLALNLFPKLDFGRANTTVNPMRPETASALVTAGLYRYSRNPMYLGQVLVLLAWVMYCRNVAGLLIVGLHVLYLTWLQIIPEERVLLRRFPDQYPAFMQNTRRWL